MMETCIVNVTIFKLNITILECEVEFFRRSYRDGVAGENPGEDNLNYTFGINGFSHEWLDLR